MKQQIKLLEKHPKGNAGMVSKQSSQDYEG